MSEFLIPRSTLQNEVASRLRDEIIQGQWKPGERLPERLLCERYGISRSPLREAYQALIVEGLLQVVPNRGAIVTAPTTERTMQHFQLLRALEILGVRLACSNASVEQLDEIARTDHAMNEALERGDFLEFLHINNQIHRQIVVASGNEPLADAHLITSRQIIRVHNLNSALAHVAREGAHEHESIIRALTARDEEAAVALFTEHLATVEDNLQRRLQDFAFAA
jgi:DNA-binding GntR family transcriptional regulator